jgi:secondary thiamine-phosphate synthase enzyme
MIWQQELTIQTRGRGTYEVTRKVRDFVAESSLQVGLCHLFVHHTSASLILCENADPSVRTDLERFLSQLAPDGRASYAHSSEGPDDMPAHIRSILTNVDLTVPVVNGACALGTWQGIYLYEHRTQPHRRRITLTARD